LVAVWSVPCPCGAVGHVGLVGSDSLGEEESFGSGLSLDLGSTHRCVQCHSSVDKAALRCRSGRIVIPDVGVWSKAGRLASGG
jgi:hypothetical protein